MTEMTVMWDDRDMSVELCAEGHAGYAPSGQDIVCASVSILSFSLAAVAAEYRRDGAEVTVDVRDGLMRIYARFEDKGLYERFSQQIHVALTGYEMLATQYPTHFCLKKIISSHSCEAVI